jgi:hypothetical protein
LINEVVPNYYSETKQFVPCANPLKTLLIGMVYGGVDHIAQPGGYGEVTASLEAQECARILVKEWADFFLRISPTNEI